MGVNDRSYSEKRDYIRMRVETTVILYHGGQEIPAHCFDLSSTGMLLEATSAVTLGEIVKVHIPSDHAALKGLDVKAEIIRAIDIGDGRQSIGLTVLEMS
jgi:hypothetical protein